jgi:hypothetical protein
MEEVMKTLSGLAVAGCALLLAGCATEVQRQYPGTRIDPSGTMDERSACQDAQMEELPICEAIQEEYERQ